MWRDESGETALEGWSQQVWKSWFLRESARLLCPVCWILKHYDGIDESFGVALERRPELITT